MKTPILTSLLSLCVVLAGSAQQSGGAEPSGGGGAVPTAGGSSGPNFSKRMYQGSELGRKVDDRDAYVEPESKTAPYYPRALRQAGIKGTVVLEVEVGRDNAVRNPRVIKSAHPELDMLAIETVLNWRYASAVVNGLMARSRIEVAVKFDPEEAESERKVRMAKLRGRPSRDLPSQYQYDQAPDLVRSVKAVYPYDLLMKGKTGHAKVTFIVDPTGNARGAVVEKASRKDFGLAAAAMVEAWTFEPAMKDGKPSWALLNTKLIFKRTGSDAPIDAATVELAEAIKNKKVKLHEFAKVDTRPRPIYQVGPELPEALRKSKKGATAEIEFIIDHDGRVRLPRIVKSSDKAFGWAAATAVSRWFFTPPSDQGEPVYVRVRVPLAYEPPR